MSIAVTSAGAGTLVESRVRWPVATTGRTAEAHEAQDDAARKADAVRRASGAATRDRLRFEILYAKALQGRLEDTRADLREILARHITDARRFSVSSLLESVEAALQRNVRRLADLARGELPSAASLGLESVDRAIEAAGIRITLAQQVDGRLVQSAYSNSVDLLSPAMQQFQAQAAVLARRVSLGVTPQADALRQLGATIHGAGFDGYAYRAERILRTEVSRVLSTSAYDRLVDQAARFPFIRKGWRATKDSRTRETHTEAGRRYGPSRGIPVGDLFRVGDVQMRFPVDPEATPDGPEAARETILCRCNIMTEMDPDAYRAFTAGQVSTALRGVLGGPGAATPPTPTTVLPVLPAPAPLRTRATRRPLTPPLAAPVSSGPSLVGSKLGVPLGAQYQPVREALAVIDALHTDGPLETIALKKTRAKSYYGLVHVRGAELKRFAISEAGLATHPRMTIAHEVGHWLDAFGIQKSPVQIVTGADGASVRLRGARVPGLTRPGEWTSGDLENPLMAAWREAARASQAIQSLIRLRPSKHRNYLLKTHEVWARAYAQWVATRSGDAALLRELGGLQASPGVPEVFRYRHWSDEDFAPIGRAIDEILRRIGWRLSPQEPAS